ncbi:MAG: phage portal protein [Chitinispirillales bacterium]|jgi:HK97 family phage portal protein|nr:phage portal protein [Chitinispirillales bacterium]
MGIFTTLTASKQTEKRSAGIPDFLMGNAVGRSGIAVNEASALSLSPIFSVLSRIAGIISMLPFKTYKGNIDGTLSRVEHPALRLWMKDPNENFNAYQLKYATVSNLLLHGCGALEIVFGKNGFPEALIPIHPTNIQVVNNTQGKISYRVTRDGGTQAVLQNHQLLLFKLFPKSDGSWVSPLTTHRAIFEEALALREFSSTVFSQGCNPAGIVTNLPSDLTEESKTTLVESLRQYEGLSRSHKLMLLEGDMKFERVAAPSTDLQYVETRRFQISEFARLYNVPLFLLAETEKSTSWGSGLESQSSGFVQYVLSQYLVNIESELNKKLFSVDDDSVFVKAVVDGLLRGNVKDRMEAYKTAAGLGVLSINEIRDLEERNALPDKKLGEARLVPVNYQSLERAVNGTPSNIDSTIPDDNESDKDSDDKTDKKERNDEDVD